MRNNTQTHGLTLGFIDVGLTLPSTSVYSTAVAAAGFINGKFVTSLGVKTTQATPTTDATTGAAFIALIENKATVLVFGQTAAGAIAMSQGSIVDTYVGVTTTVGAFKNAPEFPTLPDNFLPLAYVLVRTAPDAADWTPGTGSWTASGVTTGTVVDIGALPDRPQIA
mgnify:FL=1